MASPQSSADAVRLAVGSTSTCTSATAVLLSDLLSPKVDEGATSTTISRKGPQSSKTSSQRQTKAQSGRARSKTGALGLGEDNCRDYLSPKERSILATEVINATLKSLSDAIKAQSSTPIHRPVPGKDLVKSTTRRGLRRSNSLPPSPLQARSLNRVLSSPNIATRENRSSSSASSISSTCRPTAECARIAFACLRVLSAPTSQEVTLPTLQLENGMSTLVGKLISLGLDDLAVKELRVLKRRLETPDVPKKGPIPRPNTTIISQTLPELLDFGGISATGEKASLVTTTQVQVLRLMTSARKPKLVEEALKVLDLKHASSPTRLLLVEAELCKDKKQSDKIARKIQALSEILLSLCPPVSATDDALAQEARVSISPEVAVRIQCLALHNRFLWWGLAGHQGDLSKDIFEPFLRCLQAFARRSQGSTEETYLLASSVSKDLQTLLSDCSDTQPRALKSTLAGIYRLLGSLSRDANHIQDAIKWTEHGQRVLDLSFDSDAKRCSILARLISLKFRKAPLDSKDEELLLTLLEGLERPFKGEMPEIDDLMLEVSNARRFVIAMLSQNMASPDTNLQDQLSAGMREMCEQLIFLCPRLCLRYLGNNPDHKAGTKDIVRYEQRRQFIAKRGLCSIDSALFLVRSILGQDRVAWELVDSKLQDCLLLLDRLDINSREMPGEGEQSSKAYYTRISNLYYTQFLNMKRVVESKDGQQIRALRRSIDSIRGRPQQERKGGQFSTKLERMAEICRTTGRYDELYTTLIALRDELIEEGVLSDVAENASYQPIPAAWALNEKTSGLARTIQSILKVQLRYLKMPHPMSLVPDSWAVEERGIVLEHQIDVLLNQAKSNSVLETELSIVKELLSIYTKKDYPLRRLRVLLRISTEALDNQESVMQELELLRVEDLNLGESQDQGLQKFLCHYRALTMTTLALRKAQPDPEELKESISTWLSIRAQSKDSATFQDHIGDIRQLLVHLDSIASWLQMKGLDSTRVSALRLIADINELCGDCSTPDDLVLSFSRLGDQWLQLGYSRKAGLALDKATSYNHRKGVSSYVSLELHLSYCRYLIAIGSLDEVDDHMACAQTFYVQQKDFLAKSCSTSVLQQRTMMNLLVSNAYAISSSLAHRRGAGHIALSHAKQSLRLLRRAWVNTSNESQARPQAGLQVDMDKLTEDISEMSLSNSRISLVENGLEHASRPSLWGLVTPLFRSLTHLSSLFEHHGMFQETSYYAEQAYRFAKETQSDSLLAVASTLLGSVWLKAGSLDKGSDLLMHAEKLLSKSHPSRQSVVLSYNMGLMYSLLGDHIGEVEAYNNAVATIEMLVNSNHIQSIEGINNDPSSLEAQMSSLSLEKQKVVRTRKPATRTKKITTRKAAVRAKTPVEAIAPVADECPPLMYLKAEILRQKATALMITKKLSDSLQLLDEVDTHYSTHIDPVGHKVLKARHLLLQCFDQMNADPVYSVLQDSTISFPSAVGPLREKHGDKLAAGKQSPSRRLQAGRNNRERIASKTPSPDTFFEKLRQAQDLLIEAHAVALALSPVAVIHNVASLLHSVAILLSAVSPTKGKALAYPGTGLCSIGTSSEMNTLITC
jgi:separase